MECKDCKYKNITNVKLKNGEFNMQGCLITHILNKESCDYIISDEEVDDMKICYNCKSWIGCGDWGLSCMKNYYNCSTNGFNKACEQFERK